MRIRLRIVIPGLLLAILISMLATQAIAAGGNGESSEISTVGQELDGTWLVTVDRPDPRPGAPPTFRALLTFFPGGAMMETATSLPPSSRGPGHGQWVRIGDRTFASTFMFFRFDATGRFIGSLKVHRRMVLARSLRRFRAVATVEIFDADDNLVATERATEVGKRLTIRSIPDDTEDGAEDAADVGADD